MEAWLALTHPAGGIQGTKPPSKDSSRGGEAVVTVVRVAVSMCAVRRAVCCAAVFFLTVARIGLDGRVWWGISANKYPQCAVSACCLRCRLIVDLTHEP